MNSRKSLIALIAVAGIISIQTQQLNAAEQSEDKVCTDSKVQGQGRPNKMRSMANMNAIIDWMNATKKKHGKDYAQWHFANENTVKCRKAGDFNICLAEGTPCKPKAEKTKGS